MKSYYGPWVPKKSQKAASGLGAGFLPVFRKDNEKTKKSVSPSKSAPRGANDPADPTDEYLLQMQEAQMASAGMSLSKRNSLVNRKVGEPDRAAANIS